MIELLGVDNSIVINNIDEIHSLYKTKLNDFNAQKKKPIIISNAISINTCNFIIETAEKMAKRNLLS